MQYLSRYANPEAGFSGFPSNSDNNGQCGSTVMERNTDDTVKQVLTTG
jgi:hypothetical protein